MQMAETWTLPASLITERCTGRKETTQPQLGGVKAVWAELTVKGWILQEKDQDSLFLGERAAHTHTGAESPVVPRGSHQQLNVMEFDAKDQTGEEEPSHGDSVAWS